MYSQSKVQIFDLKILDKMIVALLFSTEQTLFKDRGTDSISFKVL